MAKLPDIKRSFPVPDLKSPRVAALPGEINKLKTKVSLVNAGVSAFNQMYDSESRLDAARRRNEATRQYRVRLQEVTQDYHNNHDTTPEQYAQDIEDAREQVFHDVSHKANGRVLRYLNPQLDELRTSFQPGELDLVEKAVTSKQMMHLEDLYRMNMDAVVDNPYELYNSVEDYTTSLHMASLPEVTLRDMENKARTNMAIEALTGFGQRQDLMGLFEFSQSDLYKSLTPDQRRKVDSSIHALGKDITNAELDRLRSRLVMGEATVDHALAFGKFLAEYTPYLNDKEQENYARALNSQIGGDYFDGLIARDEFETVINELRDEKYRDVLTPQQHAEYLRLATRAQTTAGERNIAGLNARFQDAVKYWKDGVGFDNGFFTEIMSVDTSNMTEGQRFRVETMQAGMLILEAEANSISAIRSATNEDLQANILNLNEHLYTFDNDKLRERLKLLGYGSTSLDTVLANITRIAAPDTEPPGGDRTPPAIPLPDIEGRGEDVREDRRYRPELPPEYGIKNEDFPWLRIQYPEVFSDSDLLPVTPAMREVEVPNFDTSIIAIDDLSMEAPITNSGFYGFYAQTQGHIAAESASHLRARQEDPVRYATENDPITKTQWENFERTATEALNAPDPVVRQERAAQARTQYALFKNSALSALTSYGITPPRSSPVPMSRLFSQQLIAGLNAPQAATRIGTMEAIRGIFPADDQLSIGMQLASDDPAIGGALVFQAYGQHAASERMLAGKRLVEEMGDSLKVTRSKLRVNGGVDLKLDGLYDPSLESEAMDMIYYQYTATASRTSLERGEVDKKTLQKAVDEVMGPGYYMQTRAERPIQTLSYRRKPQDGGEFVPISEIRSKFNYLRHGDHSFPDVYFADGTSVSLNDALATAQAVHKEGGIYYLFYDYQNAAIADGPALMQDGKGGLKQYQIDLNTVVVQPYLADTTVPEYGTLP